MQQIHEVSAQLLVSVYEQSVSYTSADKYYAVIFSYKHKKLSYRRETVRQLCMSIPRLAKLLIVQCTEHLRIAAKVVLFLTFKRSDSRSAGRKRILS